MRILINAVSSARYPSGICRHAANLARSLAKTAEVSHIRLLVGEWQESYFRRAFRLCDQKLETFAVNISQKPLDRNRWYLRGLPGAAAEYSADLVHLSFPVPFLRGRFTCPVIASLHDLYPYDAPGNFGFPRVIINQLLLRQCLRRSDAIVCGSDFTLDRLRSIAPRIAATKAIRIYQCVEVDPANKRQPQLDEISGRPFLLSVAQHRSNKNLALLIKAYAELLRRDAIGRSTCLLIVGGDGPETHHLKTLVSRLSLDDRVHFRASVTDPGLCWLYTNCVAFLAPSVTEGFGMPVIEALLCGSRTVCSDIPVFREIAGAACHYFSLQSKSPASALADAVQTALCQQPRRAEMPERFSAQEIGIQYVSLYSRVLNARSSLAGMEPTVSLSQTVPYDKVAG
jgi:glycosyltransferase involved in cell wall biosynthesis